jgi:hypothetical protein
MGALKDGSSFKSFKLPTIGTAMTACVALAAWTRADPSGPEAQPISHTPSYLPSVSDFVIATIHPRRIRLWLAAQNKNWDFACVYRKLKPGRSDDEIRQGMLCDLMLPFR